MFQIPAQLRYIFKNMENISIIEAYLLQETNKYLMLSQRQSILQKWRQISEISYEESTKD